VERAGPNSLTVTGELSIHGVTKPLTVLIEHAGPVISPFGGEVTMGFSAAFEINREDFGIIWNVPMKDNAVMVSKEVSINLDIEADKEVT